MEYLTRVPKDSPIRPGFRRTFKIEHVSTEKQYLAYYDLDIIQERLNRRRPFLCLSFGGNNYLVTSRSVHIREKPDDPTIEVEVRGPLVLDGILDRVTIMAYDGNIMWKRSFELKNVKFVNKNSKIIKLSLLIGEPYGS